MPSLLAGDALSQQTLDDIFGARASALQALQQIQGIQTAITTAAGQIGTQISELEGLIQQATEAAEGVEGAIDAHNAIKTAHGATHLNQARTIVLRNTAGRFKVSDPSASDDVATKGYVDKMVTGKGSTAFEIGSAGVFDVSEDHRNALLIASTQGTVEIRMPHPAGFGDSVFDMGFAIRIAASPSASGALYLTSAASGASMIARNPDVAGLIETEIGILRPGLVTIVPFRRPSGGEAGPWEWLVSGDLYEI